MNLRFKERLARFCSRYVITTIDDSKRYPRYQSVSFRPPAFFTDSANKDVLTYDEQNFETEPYLTIGIPLSKLEAIAELEATFYNNIQDNNHRRTFETWMEQQAEERRLRNKYPALKNAFESYSVLLHLVQENPAKFNNLPD